MTPKEFRATHQPESPPYLGVNLREGDCRCLAQGVVTDSVRQMAQDALKEFWPVAEAEEATEKLLKTGKGEIAQVARTRRGSLSP